MKIKNIVGKVLEESGSLVGRPLTLLIATASLSYVYSRIEEMQDRNNFFRTQTAAAWTNTFELEWRDVLEGRTFYVVHMATI
jgi:hypothetical protein